MVSSTVLPMAVVVVMMCAGALLVDAAKWSYAGDYGPMNWHKHYQNACAGRYQSPIDLKAEQTSYNPDLKDFAIWYDPPKEDTVFLIHNNGHTAQVDVRGEMYVTNGGLPNVYKTEQFHFHWGHKAHHGSEHLLEGKASPIELHIVNYNKDLYPSIKEAVIEKGGLAVLGVMYEISEEDNPALEYIIRGLKHIKLPVSSNRIKLPALSLRSLLPQDITRYYRYNGSLTTPSCFESVIWTVFEQKQTISENQLQEFRTLLQAKHKPGKHKRSLPRAQDMMRHEVDEIFEEIGITGKKQEESALKAAFLLQRQEEMLADMSHDPEINSHSSESSKGKGSMKSDSKEYMATPSHDTAAVEDSHEELVNNYRPIQPLNDRIVYRSFKIRSAPRPEVSPHYETPSADRSHNAGTQLTVPVLLLMAACLSWLLV
ncbi:carbonic anhydrase 14-like [Physella acuta]|uniref:carbonic anhydrase 14-like n=1 Tax=Physella acuta TaxID=109671 RepID=UPI0027DCF4DA|nr:carbonic anhydrase 14-like [Physella acuta]